MHRKMINQLVRFSPTHILPLKKGGGGILNVKLFMQYQVSGLEMHS